jgi:hypothetical protein
MVKEDYLSNPREKHERRHPLNPRADDDDFERHSYKALELQGQEYKFKEREKLGNGSCSSADNFNGLDIGELYEDDDQGNCLTTLII